MTDVFEAVKDAVPVPDAVRTYGFTPNRAGFVCCPFHSERTPSLKLYSRTFHCFGCGAHGSVIDFVATLFRITPMDAVKRLNEDFRLGLQMERGDPDAVEERRRTREAQELFTEWRETALNLLGACIRKAHLADFNNLSDGEATAIRYKEAFEYWADALMDRDMDKQMEIFRDEGVISLCRRILNDTQTRSSPQSRNALRRTC